MNKYSLSDIFLWFHAHVSLDIILLATEHAQRYEQLSQPSGQGVDACRQIATEFEEIQTTYKKQSMN